MLQTRIRFGLILLFLGLGFLLMVKTGFSNALPLFLGAILLLVTHFLFGSVWVAFNHLKRGNPMKAEMIVNQIKRPEWLIKRNRAYYYFIKGMIDLQNKDLEDGEKNLLTSLETGMEKPTDKALVNLNLAHIYYLRKKFDSARKHLAEAKAQEVNDLLIKDNIEKLEKAMAAAN